MEIMLFVYGTLLTGESNHKLMQGARLVAGQACTAGKLYDTGFGYPALVVDGGDREVYGQLYGIDTSTLSALDELEDYYGPVDERNLYERVEVLVTTDSTVYTAFTYVFTPEAALTCRWIPIGDWCVDQRIEQSLADSWLYYAYGSCMDDARLQSQGVESLFLDEQGRGVLAGYTLRFTCRQPDGGRADLVEEGGAAEGKLYRIGKEAVQYLWKREGVEADVYRPSIVFVQQEDGTTNEALTFFVRHKAEDTAPPTWYMEEILRGAKPVVSGPYFEFLRRLAERWTME
jgi:gamma-glutamylcyclotransferase (GGCT)/AIG2-like uncharacterized protein YtfP